MKKRIILIIFYFILMLLEIIGFIYSINEIGINMFLYYTELSNMLLLFSSILELYFLLKNKKRKPILIKKISYTSVLGTTLTLLVVLSVLGPNLNFDYNFLLLDGSMLFHHLLCPILGLILFLCSNNELNKKDILDSLSFTFIYAIVFIMLNLLRIVKGPYFFLEIYSQSLLMSIIWFLTIIGMSYIISRVIYILKKKKLTKYKK